MASFRDSLTHRYDFDETSGPLLDKVGSKDSEVPVGAPVYNGNNITLDGVDDYFKFLTANNPVDFSADFTFYICARATEIIDGNIFVFNDLDIAGEFVQFSWDDKATHDSAENEMRVLIGDGAVHTTDYVRLDIGRPYTDTEIWVLSCSYVVSTKAMKFTILSSEDIDMSGTLTPAANAPAGTGGMFVGVNRATSLFTGMDIFEWGILNGTAKSIVDMQDTADEVLALTVTDTDQIGAIYPDNGILTRVVDFPINRIYS